MRLEDLAQRLVDAGIGTLAVDLFIYAMPPEVNRGVLLHSGLSADTLSYELPGYRPGASFQLIVRNTTYPDGFRLIDAAVAAATILRPTMLGSYRINYLRARHDPLVYPRSDGGGLEFSVNFDVNFVAPP